MPPYDQLSLLVALVAVGVGAALFLDMSMVWLLALVLAGVAAGGTQSLLASHPAYEGQEFPLRPRLWLLPILFLWGGILLLLRLRAIGVEGYGLGISFLVIVALFALILVAFYNAIAPEQGRWWELLSLVPALAAYLAAFAIFASVHTSDYLPVFGSEQWWRGSLVELEPGDLASMAVVGVVSFLLSGEIFRQVVTPPRRSLLYAAATAVLMAEVAWGLRYWFLGGMAAGAILTLSFYCATGIVRAHLVGRLGLRLALEFGIAASVGLAIIYWLPFLLG